MSHSPRDRRSIAHAHAEDAEAPTTVIPAAPPGTAPTAEIPDAALRTTAQIPVTEEVGAGTDSTRASPTRAAHRRPQWFHVLRTSFREFVADECIDLAAGLTFRGLLSVFPALVALVSILSLLGQGGSVITSVLDEVEQVTPSDTVSSVRPTLESVLDTPAPGWGLLLGLAIALWSASGFVKAFSRAMNTVVGVPEGRGPIVFNVVMYLLTAFILVLGAVVLLVVVLSGPIAQAVGGLLGVGGLAVAVWDVARWFLLAFIVVLLVALLYHATPNVKRSRFRWLSLGALVAILVSIAATLGFLFYVSRFGAYNATYGALTGVIILMLWVFIMNATLLFGAQLDSEIERMRQLREGLPAEEDLQLPVRSTKASDKQAKQYAEDVLYGRSIRLDAAAARIDAAERRNGAAARRDGAAAQGDGAAAWGDDIAARGDDTPRRRTRRADSGATDPSPTGGRPRGRSRLPRERRRSRH